MAMSPTAIPSTVTLEDVLDDWVRNEFERIVAAGWPGRSTRTVPVGVQARSPAGDHHLPSAAGTLQRGQDDRIRARHTHRRVRSPPAARAGDWSVVEEVVPRS
jgi:hypothetical protein